MCVTSQQRGTFIDNERFTMTAVHSRFIPTVRTSCGILPSIVLPKLQLFFFHTRKGIFGSRSSAVSFLAFVGGSTHSDTTARPDNVVVGPLSATHGPIVSTPSQPLSSFFFQIIIILIIIIGSHSHSFYERVCDIPALSLCFSHWLPYHHSFHDKLLFKPFWSNLLQSLVDGSFEQ